MTPLQKKHLEFMRGAEPVAFIDNRIHGFPDCFVNQSEPPHTSPVYTTPPKRTWVGLTDEEKLVANQMWRVMDAEGFIKAIEAKLKEKNT